MAETPPSSDQRHRRPSWEQLLVPVKPAYQRCRVTWNSHLRGNCLEVVFNLNYLCIYLWWGRITCSLIKFWLVTKLPWEIQCCLNLHFNVVDFEGLRWRTFHLLDLMPPLWIMTQSRTVGVQPLNWGCKTSNHDINPVLLPPPLKLVGTHVKVILVAYETQLIAAHKSSVTSLF